VFIVYPVVYFAELLQVVEDIASPKRQRLTPVGGEHSGNIDPSRIDDAIRNLANSRPSLKIAEAEENLRKPDALENDEPNLVSSLIKKVNQHSQYSVQCPALTTSKINDLEIELKDRDASEAELFQQNQKLESRCQGLEKSIQDIQPKYQEALNERGRFEHEMNESLSREKTLRQRYDSRVAELTKLKEEKATGDAELSAAREALSTSAIPEIAELNTLKGELNTAREENKRLEKRIASMQNDLEYMRTNYQQASSAAAEAANEINDLKSELATAQRKASENAVRIHEIQASDEIKQHLSRIDELETEKAEMERELEKKSEELRTLMNGRRSTRGTSVPHSPRMGTMSPSTRPMARVLSGVGSRGNSPAPGDGTAFRGQFAGDALFTTGSGARWGNHLY
jgi:chromosome segregation ATPase